MIRHGWRNNETLAAAAGLSSSLISKWMAGTNTPNLKSLRKLSPHIHMRLGDLMVLAGLATAEELGITNPPPPPPLRPELAQIDRALDDPNVPASAKAHLLGNVKAAWVYWLNVSGLKAPHEPSAAERAGNPEPNHID